MNCLGLAAAAALLLVLAPPPTCMGQDLPPPLPEKTQFEAVCNPDNYGTNPDPAVPNLPQQFSIHIEANIINRNRILWIRESFDEVNNRGRFDFFNRGMRERVIYDYNNNEIFVFPDVRTGAECTVHPLAESRFINFTFGLTRVNGSIHIGSARNFLEFLDDDTPINFIGANSSVRGVPALQWEACMNNDNFSVIVNYYYNYENWSYPTVSDPSGSNSTLSQIVVRGVSSFNNTVRNFYHVYSIYGFHSGPESVPDEHFRVPTGLTCTGRIPGTPVPTVPNYFSFYAERIDSSQRTVSVFREFYDYEHQLFRLDGYYNGQFGGNAAPFQLIQDFDSQVYYYIDQHTGNCSASPLREARFINDVTLDEDGTPHLLSPTRLLLLDSNFTYEGVTTMRGVEVDAWIAERDSLDIGTVKVTNIVYEIFFTRPGYTLSTDRSASMEPVPWAYNLRGISMYPNYSDPTNTSTRAFNSSGNLYDFSGDEPPYDAFDASLCFSADDTHTVGLLFETPRVGIDFRVFRTNLRASLVNYLNLRPLQINNIHIIFDNGTHLFVAMHLTNISEFATPRDSDITADEAADVLQNVADLGESLPFSVDLGNGMNVAPVFFGRRRGRGTNFNNNNDTCNNTCPTFPPPMTGPPTDCPVTAPDTPTDPATTMKSTTAMMTTTVKPGGSTTDSTCRNNITGRLGLSDEIVAAIAIALFVVGFIAALITGLICYICCKCMKGKGSLEVTNVKYKKHDNELESF